MIEIGDTVHVWQPGDFRCRPAIVTDTGPELVELWVMPGRFTEPFTTDATAWFNPRAIPQPDGPASFAVTWHTREDHERAIAFGTRIVPFSHLFVVGFAGSAATLDALSIGVDIP